MLREKHIVLGVTGSIAAYKSALLIRSLMKAGAEVQVVMTPAAKEFITPLTLSTLSRRPVISEFFARRDGSWHSHVDLGLWADAMLVAPATAATIGKMAQAVADNMLVTTYLACKAPVFVAPAMDRDMFAHPATQRNLTVLRSAGNIIIEPTSGELASSLSGKGRMEEPEAIVRRLSAFFAAAMGQLAGRRVLVTAGPTYERIDPVRYIGNFSSGKMGFALAEVCAAAGAEVTLVSGPSALETVHPAIRRVPVESAEEMYRAAVEVFPTMDAALLCAAVADYRPAEMAVEKIRRERHSEMVLQLVANPDIAASLGAMKKAHQTLVGFALETGDGGCTVAADKLRRKNLDIIVLNSLSDSGAGFGCDTNKVTILDREGGIYALPLKMKTEVAADIVAHLCDFVTRRA